MATTVRRRVLLDMAIPPLLRLKKGCQHRSGATSLQVSSTSRFCILEALQNIQKYAQASSATVRIRAEGDQLSIEVADDGCGFDVSTTIRGNGLTNMEDRLDALGGTLHIASSPGSGTTLRATIPVLHALPAGGSAEPAVSARRH
jgi:signal transduction histidine kinase